jgi:hypothetical protein
MAGTSINVGNQQVSIYPYQQLSSVYGNEVSYGILNPGVYSAGLTITQNGSAVTFHVQPGTTLVFQRQALDPVNNAITDIILGKIVLGSTADVGPFTYGDLWGGGNTSASSSLYIVADWTYDLTNPTLKYATLSLITDSDITNLKSADGTTTHQLIIATILNQQFYVTDWAGPKSYSTDMSYYHISYDYQPNRDVYRKLYADNNYFRVDFDGKGRGVYVSAGHFLNGGDIVYKNPTFALANTYSDKTLPFDVSQLVNNVLDEGHYLVDRRYNTAGIGTDTPNDSANILRPAVGIANYYSLSGYQTNTPIDVVATATQSSYYQIDFLRVKKNEIDHSLFIGWESFLQPNGSLDFITFGITPENMMSYLMTSGFLFPLSGDGLTLLIAIRPRGGNGQYVTIPTSDGTTNKLWPNSCLIINKDAIPIFGTVPKHNRFKLPVWNSTDIGAY